MAAVARMEMLLMLHRRSGAIMKGLVAGATDGLSYLHICNKVSRCAANFFLPLSKTGPVAFTRALPTAAGPVSRERENACQYVSLTAHVSDALTTS